MLLASHTVRAGLYHIAGDMLRVCGRYVSFLVFCGLVPLGCSYLSSMCCALCDIQVLRYAGALAAVGRRCGALRLCGLMPGGGCAAGRRLRVALYCCCWWLIVLCAALLGVALLRVSVCFRYCECFSFR